MSVSGLGLQWHVSQYNYMAAQSNDNNIILNVTNELAHSIIVIRPFEDMACSIEMT